ncbi:MAG TPA: chemotaxis protein CheB, partial [Aestuariivirgaceae bacterium]|nr:chemotaxis protein CheB [Aestuariivirgaceae bacterium]
MAEPVSPAASPDALIPVVGIGASAGGLEPIGELLEALPAPTGMAFLIVQHLDPARASMLA